MFVLSKLFWLLAQPLSLAFVLGVSALLAGLFRLARVQGLAGGLGCLVLFVTLYTTAGPVALQVLEARFPKPSQDPANPACAIVLGGAFDTDVTTTRGGIELNQAADRFVEALRLARAFPGMKILVSGGDGSLSGQREGDAVVSRRFFESFGIGADRLIEEAASRNTFENIRNSKSLLEQAGLRDCLLITSAFHMPRAMGLMRKAGLAVTAWPTDYRTSGTQALRLDFTQPTLNAQQTSTALREWLGLLGYYFGGRISALFPAP
ncbi:YdcF family protein [Allorhizobium undicola]|uniref:YdcF family protein n=1 Tax=Allorhizobium undicola TaxID=78527 RepID=UPI000486BB56|nr:YdcF family protein [Allorhizobium undicola]